MTFEQWMLSVGKAKTTAQKYRSAVEGVISQWAKKAGITHADLANLDSVAERTDLLDQILSDPAILETERQTFISACVGQDQFRNDL